MTKLRDIKRHMLQISMKIFLLTIVITHFIDSSLHTVIFFYNKKGKTLTKLTFVNALYLYFHNP